MLHVDALQLHDDFFPSFRKRGRKSGKEKKEKKDK